MNDDELLGALGDALQPPARPVPQDGLAAIRAQAAAASGSPARLASGSGGTGGSGPPSLARRNILLGSVAAAVGAAVGVTGALVATSGDDDTVVAAPPTRPVEFSAVPEGVTVAGRTIDHTWGMELLLDVSGLPVDRDYTVAYATDAGEVAAGGFRSVPVEMVCRFNGTALRSAVSEVAITDQSTGDIVLRGRPI